MFSVHRLRWTKLKKCDGAAMVEFAIGSTVLIMFVLGIIEFGFLWYQKSVITNAAREGARYGITYQTNTDGTRKAPINFSPSIATVVNNYCTGRITAGSWSTAVADDPANTGGYTLGTKGKPVVVTVTGTNQMNLLSGIIPSLPTITPTGKSIMNCE